MADLVRTDHMDPVVALTATGHMDPVVVLTATDLWDLWDLMAAAIMGLYCLQVVDHRITQRLAETAKIPME